MGKREKQVNPKKELTDAEETEEQLEGNQIEEEVMEVQERDEEARLLRRLEKIRADKEEKKFAEEMPLKIKALDGQITKIVDNQRGMYDILQKHHEVIQDLLNKYNSLKK